jgi:hypothetical protein
MASFMFYQNTDKKDDKTMQFLEQHTHDHDKNKNYKNTTQLN